MKKESIGMQLKELSHQHIAFSVILVRCQKLMYSVLILCSVGHGEDAAVLVRILYENWIQMRFIRKNDLAKKFIDYSLIAQKNYLDILEQSFPDMPNSKTQEYRDNKSKLDENYKNVVDQFLDNKGKVKKQWSISLKDMAINLAKDEKIETDKREDKKKPSKEELLYERIMRHLSTFIHCDSRGLNNFVFDNANTIIFDSRPSEKEVDHVLIRSKAFFSKINAEWAITYNFSLPETILKNSVVESQDL